jgi:hypothetical protein
MANFQPAGAPIPGEDGQVIQRAFERGRRSFFKGKQRVGYRYLLGHVGSEYPLIERGSDDERIMRNLMSAHDGIVIRRQVLARKYSDSTESERRDMLLNSPDWELYCQARIEAGYDEKKEDINEKYAKGMFARASDPDSEDVRFKANEIIHPESGGAGATLDFTFLSNMLLERSKHEWIAAAQFEEFRMPRKTFTQNIETLDALATLGGHPDYAGTAAAPPARDYSTTLIPPTTMLSSQGFALVTWNAKHYVTVIPYNDDQEADSVIAWGPRIQSQANVGYVRATDRVTLEGDKTATHMDEAGAGNPAIDWPDVRIQAYGLRKMCKDNFAVDGGGVAITLANFDAGHAKMGLHGRVPSRVVCFAPVSAAYKLMQLSEANRVDAGMGTIRTGVLGSLRGIDIVVPEWIRLDLNASAVYESAGVTTRTYLQFARRDRFAWGRMNGLRVESFRLPGVFVTYVVSDIRQDFQAYDVNQLTSGVFQASATGAPASMVKNVLS